jgi:beta-glucosidase
MNTNTIIPLLESGAVTMATIDDKVRRILRMEIACGFLNRPQQDASIPLNDPRSAEIALSIAREGFVLVKNEHDTLPLDRTKVKKIVVVGPNADRYPAGGGSSLVTPFRQTKILDGLRQLAGDHIAVEYLGIDPAKLLEKLLPIARYEEPLKLEYRRRTARPDPMPGEPPTGRPIPAGEVTSIEQQFGSGPPVKELPPGDWVAVWSGRIRPTISGLHSFLIQSDSGIRVKVDDTDILFCFDHHSRDVAYAEYPLEAGRDYKLTVEYVRRRDNERIRFAWGPAPALFSDEERASVRAADAVIVCTGFTMFHEAEGTDRPYGLPDRQEELIRTVAALNPRTIVTLNAGGSVATTGWIDQVPALLHAFYPGQEGGRAVAEILFGDVNPSGKLPFTWEKRWEDCSAYGNFPGHTRVEYKEGIFLGYRWFDHKNIEPLFPFGHGLSYTRFAYDKLKVTRNDAGCTVTFVITNTGSRPGDEIAQVYVAPPHGTIPRPPRELKGFTRVSLAPGETRVASVVLPRDAFAYFDPQRKAWQVDPGIYQIEVGASSRDLRLHTPLTVHQALPVSSL